MMRGTFANIRIKNQMLDGVEGGYTAYIPSTGQVIDSAAGLEEMAIWDAAAKYEQEGTPLIILAGKEYGTGSSRDWAAKGPWLQGVKAVIAESYETHPSLQFGRNGNPATAVHGWSEHAVS